RQRQTERVSNLRPSDCEQQKLKLRRDAGLMGAVSLVAGTMIESPQTMMSTVGSTGASLVVWASCGLLVIRASSCYAELGTFITDSGGEYIYILRTSGPVVAYMLAFSTTLFVNPISNAAVALSFGQYTLVVKCVTAVAIIVLTCANCLSVRFSLSVQVFFMMVKIVALTVIIGGVVMPFSSHTESFKNAFGNTNVGINPAGIALYQGRWAYSSWSTLN
uniref:Uncharacterized protein n=1 Tax=Nothobranchius furzeri TaxID=105023 RepID=A0A8C6MCD3_NOTFU